ncbi:adhesion G protein-coupled receptor L1 [Trichonephila clavipes]|nr:adhesion G protein-coupled receptor L1 [Trichonephila clavipes]
MAVSNPINMNPIEWLFVVRVTKFTLDFNTRTRIYCWLSPHQGLMWSFVGPACAILFINIGIFILTLKSASNVRIKREQTTLQKIKSWTRGSLSVTCLLGLTWCLGLFYINKTLHVFSYVFILLNGLQMTRGGCNMFKQWSHEVKIYRYEDV